MIAILGAVEQEIKDIKKGMSITNIAAYGNRRIYSGKYGNQECVLAATGLGKKHAEETARFITGSYPLKAVISVGFGGALNDRTGVGDVVVYSSLICPDQKEELFSDSGLLTAATIELEGTTLRMLQGKGVTVSAVCTDPGDKKRLGEELLADITDMESYWVGRVALERGLPFLAARTIFDTVQDDLSTLEQLTDAGEIAPGKAFGYIIAHPGKLPMISAYSRKAYRARKNLAIFVEKLMETLVSRTSLREDVFAELV